jgi:hypothetical protein
LELTDHELQTLCVPLDQCILVKTGKVDPGVLAELEEHGYDQAPVYDAVAAYCMDLFPQNVFARFKLQALESGLASVIDSHFLEPWH